jgi:REP element-mobilizing transposase RayT
MPAYARREIVAHEEVGIYHCIARCVRRAFLCGVDPFTNKDHEHRKGWIRDRLKELASFFAVEVCGYAVMSNHLHVVLRSRPDLAQRWTDEEVALQWRRLFPARDPLTGLAGEPSAQDLSTITSDSGRVTELRKRLASLSWFMRCLNEPIARAANQEDGCTGRFWEGRFRSQALVDEAAILACSIYVDLNPIRAGIADTPENSQFTSAYDRIRSMRVDSDESPSQAASAPSESPTTESIETTSTHDTRRPDAWLCELTLFEGQDATAETKLATAEVGKSGTQPRPEEATQAECRPRPKLAARASDQGYLPIELEKYLSLLDWTGRQLRADHQGTIPSHFAPILERLGVNVEAWIETVQNFGRWFKRAAGRRDSLADLAHRSGRSWFHGQRAAAIAFR